MARSNHGSSVVDGEVQYLSASSLTLGDPDSAEGCLRKWWYEKIDGRRPPSTGAQELGTRLHAEIEAYLRTGVNELGALAARGKPMLPTPGPDLFIEHDIMITPEAELAAREADPGAAAALRVVSLATAPLRILNIPVVGYIDLLHARGTNKGVPDIEDTIDPPGTVEIIDWKTTSNADYIKSPDAMARSIQMTVYGKWATTTLPETKYVRLSHGYFVTRGSAAPRKVTMRLSPEQIQRQWERVERVAGSIVDAAREIDPDQVPANKRACDAYGGCPHLSYCRAGAQESLTDFFGADGAATLIRRLNKVTPTTSVNIAPRQSLLGLVKPKLDTEALHAEMVRLAREEVEAKYPGIPAVWDALEACKVGHPQYAGELARVVGELSGSVIPVTEVPGAGELASYGPFTDPSELPGLLDEVKLFLAAPPQDNVIALLPPEAPASDPVLAAAPREPEVPIVTPAKRGRGRPKKDRSAQVYDLPSGQAMETPSGQATMTFVDPIPVLEASIAQETGLYFYVNCMPSVKHKSFWPIVHELIADLNKASAPALDFRLVPTDHKFAYGRWKAAIAAALATCDLLPDHYVLDGAGGEVALAVVEAMRSIIAERGGVFVQ